MAITPDLIIAIGTAASAVGGAIWGGKRGGENSLNGFKEECRASFTKIDTKLDVLTKNDGAHEARLETLEGIAARLTERREKAEPVLEERRRA